MQTSNIEKGIKVLLQFGQPKAEAEIYEAWNALKISLFQRSSGANNEKENHYHSKFSNYNTFSKLQCIF